MPMLSLIDPASSRPFVVDTALPGRAFYLNGDGETVERVTDRAMVKAQIRAAGRVRVPVDQGAYRRGRVNR